MIDGDNRGQHYLARPRMQVVRIAHCSPGGCTRSGWSAVLQASHLPQKAHKHRSEVAHKQKRGEMLHFVTGPPFCNPGSCMSSSTRGIRIPLLSTNQERRNLFHAPGQGVGSICIGGERATLRQKTSPSVHGRVRGFATLAALIGIAGGG